MFGHSLAQFLHATVLDRKKYDSDDFLQGDHMTYMPCKILNTFGLSQNFSCHNHKFQHA